MNAHKFPAARIPLSGSKTAGVASPLRESVAAPATHSHCPDCGAEFSDRIVDEDTGCRYPVDDGEFYCEPCDHLFTADYLATEWITDFVVVVSDDGIAQVRA